MPKIVIFSDLDGTLLHPKTYSFAEAQSALQEIRKRNIPIVLCSSKTRAEIEECRRRLNNDHPFISENGGGIFMPRGYFPFNTGGEVSGDYIAILLGATYEQIRNEFVRLRERLHAHVMGFGDMTVEEIVTLTGLPRSEAALAKEREFDEPFVFEGTPDERFLKAVEETGLGWTRGRLYHIMGGSDKGKAVRMLKRWYEGEYDRIVTIGLGDGLNDLPMLRETDHPVLVRNEDGSWDPDVDLPGLIRTWGVGPAGWNEAVTALLQQL